MGLDMYLHERLYISRYKALAEDYPRWQEDFEKANAVLDAAGLKQPSDDIGGGVHVEATVMYWRKSNMIHSWFIANCGNDDNGSRRVYVDDEKITELITLCERLLEKRNVAQAESQLPPTSGFFFGSTEIDEWYWQDLQETVDGLSRAMANKHPDSWFEYQSSW